MANPAHRPTQTHVLTNNTQWLGQKATSCPRGSHCFPITSWKKWIQRECLKLQGRSLGKGAPPLAFRGCLTPSSPVPSSASLHYQYLHVSTSAQSLLGAGRGWYSRVNRWQAPVSPTERHWQPPRSTETTVSYFYFLNTAILKFKIHIVFSKKRVEYIIKKSVTRNIF